LAVCENAGGRTTSDERSAAAVAKILKLFIQFSLVTLESEG
jgi:hypothetical protein